MQCPQKVKHFLGAFYCHINILLLSFAYAAYTCISEEM